MKKKITSWGLKGYVFILLGIFILSLFLKFNNHSASSIGIIGGADGPTAVFIAEGVGTSLAGLFIILFLTCLVAYLSIKKFLINRK